MKLVAKVFSLGVVICECWAYVSKTFNLVIDSVLKSLMCRGVNLLVGGVENKTFLDE